MVSRDSKGNPQFDRSTAEGRQAEMAHLDSLTEAERAAYDPGHRYVTANPATSPEREARLGEQLADLNATTADA